MRHVLRRAGLLAALACCAPFALAAAGAELEVRIGYLGYRPDPGPLLSNVIPEPEDAGLRGAELAITDSNSTGRFQARYVLDAVTSETSDAARPGTAGC